MCMSVKKIEERINTSKNQTLLTKLNKITHDEQIDNYRLNMVSDSYGFRFIYALKHIMGGVVKIEQKLSQLKLPTRCKELATV